MSKRMSNSNLPVVGPGLAAVRKLNEALSSGSLRLTSVLTGGSHASRRSTAFILGHNAHHPHYSGGSHGGASGGGNGGAGSGNNASFTVTLSSIFIPDYDIYAVWLNGMSVDKAVEFLGSSNARGTAEPLTVMAQTIATANTTASQPPVISQTDACRYRLFVIAQYRNFGIMEHYLHKPRYFGDQFIFTLPVHVKRKLIEMYYEFDENVVRELLGKKLNYRSRKDLDDVCAKTKVSLGSCRRQFDNIKRISKKVEEAPGSLITNIEKKFLLPRQLASKYAHIIFLTTNRVETGKKKLLQFTFQDFEFCSSVFIRYWTFQSPTAVEEFDAKFVQDLRDIKSLLSNSKELYEELRSLTFEYFSSRLALDSTFNNTTNNSSAIPPFLSQNSGHSFAFSIFTANSSTTQTTSITATTSGSTTAASNTVSATTNQSQQQQLQILSKDFVSIFKTLTRNMLTIGTGLTQPKEVRDIFIDLVEKIVEPCAGAGWRGSDAELFFLGIREAWGKVSASAGVSGSSSGEVKKYEESWERLAIGIQLTSLRLFNDLSVALS